MSCYSATVLADGPKAYWECQEASGLPQDSSGNGLHMTSQDLTGGGFGYREPGPFDYGILANGGSRFLRAAVSTAVNNLTLEMWVKINLVTNPTQGIFSWNSGANGFILAVTTNFHFFIVVQGVATLSQSAVALPSGGGRAGWSHVVVVRDAGTWKYYLNGQVDTANAGTSTPIAPTGSTIFPGGASVQSVVAHLAMYESVLTPTQIKDHCTIGRFVPETLAYVN